MIFARKLENSSFINAKWSAKSSFWTRSALLTTRLWRNKSMLSFGSSIFRPKKKERELRPRKRKRESATQWPSLIGKKTPEPRISNKKDN